MAECNSVFNVVDYASYMRIPCNKSLLSLSLLFVSLLVVVVLLPEASMFPRSVSLVAGPVVVMSLSGPGAAAMGAYADAPDIFGLSKTTVPFFAFPISVPGSREFRAKAVGGQAPITAVVAVTVAAARPSPTSPVPGTPPVSAAIRARPIRQRHKKLMLMNSQLDEEMLGYNRRKRTF